MNQVSAASIPVSRVEGTKVYNHSGDKLGSVEDVVVDKRSGQVRYVALEFGGFLGLGSDHYPLPWSMLHYDTDKNGYVVDLDKSKLENAPHYSYEEMPPYTDAYGRKVHDHYGVEWL